MPHVTRGQYLFKKPRQVLTSTSVSHIVILAEDKILVSTDGQKTCIYRHAPNQQESPFQKDFAWELLVNLTVIDHMRINCSGVAPDYFIVANEECEFFVFDKIGYKLIDKGFVRNHKINCILMLTDNMVVFGH